ncbi:energy transducer TonB [Erythrobacter sanguineus]|nr:TonB family protein [Erythrobacter sanguineus]
MIRIATASAAALACVLAPQTPGAAQSGLPLPRSMNPVRIKVTPMASGDLVLLWNNGTVTCDSGVVEAAEWVAPHLQFSKKELSKYPVTVGFAIDEKGRAVDIRVLEGGYVAGKLEASLDPEKNTLKLSADKLLESLSVRDLMPSLRASRFAMDAPQTGCRVTYAPEYVATADLPRSELARIAAVPGIKIGSSQHDQLAEGDCNTVGWPAYSLRAYPDWRAITARDGARKWNWIGFDIDEEGVPINVTVIASSGHDDLDRESLRAISQNRFAEGKRAGCATPWWRNPGVIPAPPLPEDSTFREYQDCSAHRQWAVAPKLTFPQSYNERAIEGWAVLGFDIGADGAISNITVLSAQPSEEFGAAGKAVLQSASFERDDEAQTRCIERVRFAISKPKSAAPES